jgi:hypothetical protein
VWGKNGCRHCIGFLKRTKSTKPFVEPFKSYWPKSTEWQTENISNQINIVTEQSLPTKI